MGLTDAPKQLNLQDVYPEGTPFLIQKAWVEGVVKTQYGDRTMAKALITPVGGGTPQEFSLWGSLCEQVQMIEEGDVPGAYKVIKDPSNPKRFLFASAAEDVAAAPAPAPTPDEEQLGIQPQAGEGQPAAAPAAAPPQAPAPEQGGAPQA